MTFNQDLLNWYRVNKRSLPWRTKADPYSIWISEVMLQQTTVKAVVPYYEKFMSRFPTANHLARAPLSKVLEYWAGLGYYSRAKNLKRAAEIISGMEMFPRSFEKLRELPGIGPYTAAAIASIAFDERVPVVDGNVIRVISRLTDLAEDVGTRSGRKKIDDSAQLLIQGQPPSEHNQAMMELGATICLPRNPACFLCPVRSHCLAQKTGQVLERPIKIKKHKSEAWIWKMHMVQNEKGQLAFYKNTDSIPWLRGFWIPPGPAVPWTKRSIPKRDFVHSITHHKIYVQVLKRRPKDLQKLSISTKNLKWYSPSSVKKLGVSSAITKAMEKWEQS